MPATLPDDFSFEPKVWKDHIDAYFDKKLVFGEFAMRDNTLMGQPGETINFPYYKAIGAAEEPAVDESLSVDKIQDDAFQATIKEIGKAVGVRRGAIRKKSAATQERVFSEVQRQIARVHAEKVDADLLTEIQLPANYSTGFTAAAAADTLNVRSLNQMKINAFGDKHNMASVCFMHSLSFLSLMNDSTAGFLKADANDPLWRLPGFEGRLLGMAIVTVDSLARVTDVAGKQAYESYIMKPNAYGFMMAQDYLPESDYDVLAREYVFTATQWYAVKAFHAKISADDKLIARGTFATEVNA